MTGVSSLPDFCDFDDPKFYETWDRGVLEYNTRNFLIEYDSTKAYAAFNLQEKTLRDVLKIEQPSAKPRTRWINIFGPDKQEDLVLILSKRYNFSPRLSGIMCSKHNTPTIAYQDRQPHGLRQRPKRNMSQFEAYKTAETRSFDLEMDAHRSNSAEQSPRLDLSHYKVVSQVWHYCSVDWGAKYLCIGYNSLSDMRIDKKDTSRDAAQQHKDGGEGRERSDNHPNGVRTWTWLVLCDDGTIISMYEDLYTEKGGGHGHEETTRPAGTSRNMLNVFRQLSEVNNKHRKSNPINTLDIRPGLQSNQTSHITIADSPGLLFYYLFDDWYTTYALVAKEEQQYAKLLERLRQDMHQRPDVELIQQLHQYGRQLSVLKRMYTSYALIIDRILDRQKPVSGSVSDYTNSSQTRQLRKEDPQPAEEPPADDQTFGAPLTSAAIVRFERLRDRINHYALSEIQECLDEKESLVFLNFNLLTHKESQAVERLTRITILLAKVTILFMPVSLMTAYFSTQLNDLQNIYTIRTYWICFAVIMALSFMFLLIFGAASGTLEGKPIYRSLTQTIIDAGKGKWRERRERKGR